MSDAHPHRSGYARRDRLICWACNQLLRLASPRYRAMIGGSIVYGLRSAAIDAGAQERIVFDHIRGEIRRERA